MGVELYAPAFGENRIRFAGEASVICFLLAPTYELGFVNVNSSDFAFSPALALFNRPSHLLHTNRLSCLALVLGVTSLPTTLLRLVGDLFFDTRGYRLNPFPLTSNVSPQFAHSIFIHPAG